MDNKTIKTKAIETALNCVSAKEINGKVKEFIEGGINKETALKIVTLAKEIRKNRLETIKVTANGLKYDSAKTLSVIWKNEYNGKDWKALSKKNETLCKIDSLENFLLCYYPYVTESGKMIINTTNKETKVTTHKERDIHKVNAQSVWNKCVDNVLRETSDKKKIQTIYKDSDILTLEKQAEIKAEKTKK